MSNAYKGWEPLPSFATDPAPPVPVRALDRIRSLSALRILMAMHCIAGLTGQHRDGMWAITCSNADLRGYSGLSASAAHRAIKQLEDAGVVRGTKWDPDFPQVPRTYVLLPL